MTFDLTIDQAVALREISAHQRAGDRYLLTGYAGSGKTTLMQEYARQVRASGRSIVLTAPTHKAVGVLRKRVDAAGIDVECRTLAALLQLKPTVVADRDVYERKKHADPVMEHVVVIDECSMIGVDLFRHIRRHLPVSFVLFVGDPAQLPPVNEIASPTFETKARSHLDTIVRQGAGNPVLDAAHVLRESQGGPMDWSWCRKSNNGRHGLYKPRDIDAWMRHAFAPETFDEDPDRFRYLAWTNEKVAAVNARIRRWRYGDDLRTPFEQGERALLRKPLIRGENTLLNTNEEVWIRGVREATFTFDFPGRNDVPAWRAQVPSWHLMVERENGDEVEADMPQDIRVRQAVIDRATDEAAESTRRWNDRAAFLRAMLVIEPVYAMTVHTSQGSTFGNVFLDVQDIRRRVESNLLEAQQLLYVAITRPTDGVILVGAP